LFPTDQQPQRDADNAGDPPGRDYPESAGESIGAKGVACQVLGAGIYDAFGRRDIAEPVYPKAHEEFPRRDENRNRRAAQQGGAPFQAHVTHYFSCEGMALAFFNRLSSMNVFQSGSFAMN